MNSKSQIVKNVLCVAVSVALVLFTESGKEVFAEAVVGICNSVSAIDKENLYINMQSTGAVVDISKNTFSPEGFGGGGYSGTQNQTSSDIATLKAEAEAMYKSFKKSGTIKEQHLGGGNVGYGAVKVNNRTSQKIDVQKLLNKTPSYGKITKEQPYILIYHTHTTEGYELLDKGWYSDEYKSRTEDENRNMVRVGKELKLQLEKAGFKVIHDTKIYDKSYDGAYSRSLKSVEKYLKEYPSIVLTLDVHRDAIHYDNSVKCKPTALINDKKAAQVMIISGCEGNGVSGFENWEKNLVFALSLQNSVEEKYAGLMRPVFFCHRKYNMNVTPCSLLLEFGTDANTLEEAVYSASLVGEALGGMLNDNL